MEATYPAVAWEVEKDDSQKVSFFLFILLNATLFIRPAEIIPGLQGLPIYNGIILLCLLASAARIRDLFATRLLAQTPTLACVIGVGLAIVASHLANGNAWSARSGGVEFFKVVLYVVLFLATINTFERLTTFLRWVVRFILVVTVLAVLHFHGLIEIETLTEFAQKAVDEATGEIVIIPRLQGTGLFNDPNDMSMILNWAIFLSLYFFFEAPGRAGRALWLGLIALFAYGVVLTQSRGGFLALVGGVTVLFYCRYGLVRTAGLLLALSPVALYMMVGRLAKVSLNEDTAGERLQLWSEGLTLMRQYPLFGIGEGQFGEHMGLVAHNSFVHCYTELGFLGGTFFFGAFYSLYCCGRSLQRSELSAEDSDVLRFNPYYLALLAGFAGSLLSLSRPYIVPTYMVLTVGTAYYRMVQDVDEEAGVRLTPAFVRQLLLVSAVYLVGTYVFVRVMVRW